MSEKKIFVPKRCQGRLKHLAVVIIVSAMVCIVLGVLYGSLIYNIIVGKPLMLTITSVGSLIILSTLLILIALLLMVQYLRERWIEFSDIEIRISIWTRWRVIPFKEISSFKKLPNGDLEISHSGTTTLLEPSDLGECYEDILTRLQR